MKHFNLLKTTLLLCALIVGSLSGWADETEVLSFSRSGTTNSSTKDFTFSAQAEAKSGYYQDGSGIERSLKLYSTSTKLFDSTPGTVTFTAKLGGGTTKDPLANNVYVCFVDKSGNAIEGSDVVVTSKITNTTGSNFSVKMSSEKAASAYGVKLYHVKETGYNVRYYSFSLSYEMPAYVITSISNNDVYGTVSGTSTIFASPNDGYRVKEGDAGYTVTAGTATVVNNGDNTFTVNPTTDCTVQINFEPIPAHQVICVANPTAGGDVEAVTSSLIEGRTSLITASAKAGYKFTGWSVTGDGASLSSVSSNPTTLTMGTEDATVTASFEAVTTYEINWSVNGTIVKTENVEENMDLDFSSPTSGVPTGYTFVGWVVEADKIETPTDVEPSINYVSSGKSVANVTYYAIMAKVIDSIPANWGETPLDNLADGDVFVIVGTTDTNSYALSNDGGTSAPVAKPITISGGEISSAVENNLKWNISGNSTDGYVFYPNGSTTTWLYCISNNNGVRVGTGEDKTFVMKDSYLYNNGQSRYIGVYESKLDWRCYTGYSGNIADQTFAFYKYNESVNTFGGYCTLTPSVSVEVSSAGYATFVSDFDLDYSNVAGLKAYKARVSGTTITFDKVTEVPAGEGVLLQGEGTFEVPVKSVDAWAADDNAFVRGTGAAVATGDGPYNYILNKVNGVVGFYKANGQTVAKNRAYLQSTTAAARISLNFDEETTGISEVVKSDVNNKVFDLQGRHIAQPTKGLYIMNGCKVLVK